MAENGKFHEVFTMIGRKVAICVLSGILTVSYGLIPGQTKDLSKGAATRYSLAAAPVVSRTPVTIAGSDDTRYETKALSYDLKVAEFVAFVVVKKVKQAGRSDEYTDCVNHTGNGYCSYDLTADIKELYKGRISSNEIRFSTYGEAQMVRSDDQFLGECVIFLEKVYDDAGKKVMYLRTIENSTLAIENDVLEKMRRILDPTSHINEDDETEPYSEATISNNYQEADIVVFANITDYKAVGDDTAGDYAVILGAKVIEVFKGDAKTGRKLHYKDDLTYRRFGKDDLGEQVIFLKREEENGTSFFRKLEYTEGDIKHDILGKLRKIAAGAPKSK